LIIAVLTSCSHIIASGLEIAAYFTPEAWDVVFVRLLYDLAAFPNEQKDGSRDEEETEDT